MWYVDLRRMPLENILCVLQILVHLSTLVLHQLNVNSDNRPIHILTMAQELPMKIIQLSDLINYFVRIEGIL
jgi:hypothetical protein